MEKPILFSTPMVQAIMEGRKTQTRRIVKDSMLQENNGKYDEEFLLLTVKKCPYGEVGDVLWVRETFNSDYGFKDMEGNVVPPGILYKAKVSSLPNGLKWKPSIFMPKSIARIWLQITSIKVERLKDISEEDAKAEGVEKIADYGTTGYKLYTEPEASYSDIDAKHSFESLWESINGRESWDSNPWVWVIEFKQITK
jgi:hypothetical protein